jgi:hypothetical protein
MLNSVDCLAPPSTSIDPNQWCEFAGRKSDGMQWRTATFLWMARRTHNDAMPADLRQALR